MNLFECLMKHSKNYLSDVKYKNYITPIGILLHDTAAGNPSICRYVQPYEGDDGYDSMIAKLGKNKYANDWNHYEVSKGVHAFIGKIADGSIATCQALPYNFMPWGCASGNKGTLNKCYIQFEMCDDGYESETYFLKVYQEAVEYCAYLCKKYGWNPTGTNTYNNVSIPVITCHQDAHKLGFASDHSDVLVWFKKFGKTMAGFRADVKAQMEKGSSASVTTSATPSTISSTTTGCPFYASFNATMNVRTGPGTSYSATGKYCSPGVKYEIKSVYGTWGQLSSNAGWVNCSSKYCTRTPKYYLKYEGTSSSITDALAAVGEKDTSKAHRAKIALANGTVKSESDFTGSALQNTQLLVLLKQGKLIKA